MSSRSALRHRRDHELEVGPVEAGHDRVLGQDVERRADVADHRGRRRRGQREHARDAELLRGVGELEVVGAEVVSPLRDAVRLVDGEERNLRAPQRVEEALVVEALGRDVEQRERALGHRVRERARLVGRERRVEPRGLDPAAAEEIDLVLHQRDERRDDEREPVEHQRGELVADRLSAAGGEHGERATAPGERVDHLVLAGTKRAEPEVPFEELERVCVAWTGTAGRLLGTGADRRGRTVENEKSSKSAVESRLPSPESQIAKRRVISSPPAAGTVVFSHPVEAWPSNPVPMSGVVESGQREGQPIVHARRARADERGAVRRERVAESRRARRCRRARRHASGRVRTRTRRCRTSRRSLRSRS